MGMRRTDEFTYLLKMHIYSYVDNALSEVSHEGLLQPGLNYDNHLVIIETFTSSLRIRY